MPLYAKGCKYLLSQLPEDTRKIIEDCEEKRDYSSPDYQKATSVFYGRYFCRIDPLPEPIQIGFQHLQEDCVAYQTLQGPSEFTIVGSFKDWEGWKEAHNINVPTLLLNGKYDETTDASVEPWFNAIPQVKWVTLEKSAHMTHFEERERFMELCGAFLSSN